MFLAAGDSVSLLAHSEAQFRSMKSYSVPLTVCTAATCVL